jgi:hypothetical protein
MSDAISRGPWVLKGLSPGLQPDEQVIMSADGEEVLGSSEWLTASDEDLRLISCAPELLDVARVHVDLLKGLREHAHDTSVIDENIEIVSSIIAKAEEVRS